MNVSAVSASHMAMSAAAQPLHTLMETQVTVLRELAASQQQIARMLAENGLGQTVDVRA